MYVFSVHSFNCRLPSYLHLSPADERLDEEQSRVATLENIIGQLEEKMQELSQLTLTAGPSMSALEVKRLLVLLMSSCSKQW